MFAWFMSNVEHIPGCKASRRQGKHGIPPIDLDHGHINASPKRAHQRTRTLNMCIDIVCYIKRYVHIEMNKNMYTDVCVYLTLKTNT